MINNLFRALNIFMVAMFLTLSSSFILASDTSDTIKIVSSLPRQGSIKPAMDAFIKGFEMALKEADYKAGNFSIIYEDWDNADQDGRWLADKESENANKAVLDSDVMVYLGPDPSSAATVSLPILNAANLVVINSCSYPGLTKADSGKDDEPTKYQPSGKPNMARVVPTDDVQGAMAALWAKKLNVTSVYVLSDGDLYGNQLATVFLASAKKLGLQIKNPDDNFETIDLKGKDFKSLSEKISLYKPEFIFVGINPSNRAGQLWKDLRTYNQSILMGGDSLTASTFLKEADVDAEGTYVITGGTPPVMYKGAAADWAARYQQMYNEEPGFYTIYAYEIMKVALDAIERSPSKDRESIRKAVFATQDFDKGALGSWSFDSNGDIFPYTMSILQMQDGKFEFITELKE